MTIPVQLSDDQAAFADTARHPGWYVLSGPVGTGKATALRAVIAELSRAQSCRILFVGSRSVGVGLSTEATNLPELELSKAWLRARSDEAASDWPSRVFAWAPPSTATDPWAGPELSLVPWDLVVLDSDSIENETIHGVLDPMLREATRIIVLASSRAATDAATRLPGFQVTRWASRFAGRAGDLMELPPGDFRLVTFRRDDAEVRLLEWVDVFRSPSRMTTSERHSHRWREPRGPVRLRCNQRRS